MATEAQRLITMSLGKIHTARAQRGGVNLHKSLLVTTVLFKAKAVFMVEHMNVKTSQEQYTSKVTKEEYRDEVEHESENTDSCVDNNDQVVPDIACPDSGYEDDEESGDDMDTILDKENTPPKSNSTCSEDKRLDSESETNCARRNKRKLTEVEAAVESISPKKSKFESDKSCQEKDTCEPMQTDPVQITNLVRSFNSGFGGLLSSNTQNVQEQSKVQGHVSSNSESIISCSTQIKESFDILSRPAIALSV